jgi:hypothetical protein
MEYRGYDSAGIALHQKDSIFKLRTLGKVGLLEDGMIEQRPKSNLASLTPAGQPMVHPLNKMLIHTHQAVRFILSITES